MKQKIMNRMAVMCVGAHLDTAAKAKPARAARQVIPLITSRLLPTGVKTRFSMAAVSGCALCVATSALALSFLLVGCDREVSRTESSSVSSDGTVKSTEKTVTQSKDGTVTKTEQSKKTTPPDKP